MPHTVKLQISRKRISQIRTIHGNLMNSHPHVGSESNDTKAGTNSHHTGNSWAQWFRIVRWTALLIGVMALIVLVRRLPTRDLFSVLESLISSLGMWGPVVLTLAYIVATIFLVPGTFLTLVAGALFGLTAGTITVSIGSTLGASACFLIARYVARDRVADWVQQYPHFRAIDRAIEEGGWKIVALLRLSPAIPFNVQNYLYGLTLIRFWPFVIASWLAMLPGTFLYVYLGHVTQAALGTDRTRTPGEWILLGIGLVSTLIASVYIAHLARRKIDQQVIDSNDVPKDEATSSIESETNSPAQMHVARTALLVLFAIVLAILAVNSQSVVDGLSELLPKPSETGGQHGSA